MRIELDAGLAEAAVFDEIRSREASGDRAIARRYFQELERVYGFPPGESRDAAAREHHADWFVRLGLDATVREAALEVGSALGRADRLFLHRTLSPAAEGAEVRHRILDDRGEEEHAVVVVLRASRYRDREALVRFLRHELRLAADLLDPAFRGSAAVPVERAANERLRLLWSLSADGRLARGGLAGRRSRAEWEEALTLAFRSLPAEARRALFLRLYEGPRPTSAELLALAADPCAASGGAPPGPGAGTRCPLCRFPTFDWALPAEPLDPGVVDRIRAAFVDWTPAAGACRECVDRYRVSTSAPGREAPLPPRRAVRRTP